MLYLRRFIALLLFVPLAPCGFAAPADDFFELHVRPVLATNCFTCHGPAQQMGGLRLDQAALALKGGGNGPVISPGRPETSRLILAIRYQGALKMPPSGPLKPTDVQALTEWVRLGAHWPSASTAGTANAKPSAWWSFQPVRRSPPPSVKQATWCRSPIDRFILAGLEARGLSPAPPADRATLIRRASLDLTGLPPSPDEVAAFVGDRHPAAYARLIDRLLASPHYGERWGRYWLDVARYADTKGYSFAEDAAYPHAYTYRDYVIRSFNQDVPFDRFIKEQLAADRLDTHLDRRPLAAMGFLTLGRRYLNSPPDINADRIDVVTRGFLGLTVACARCHNHKFDPISARDYYSLYSIFASSTEPGPEPISPDAISQPYVQWRERVRARSIEVDSLMNKEHDRVLEPTRYQSARYLLAELERTRTSPKSSFDDWARQHGLIGVIEAHWSNQIGAPSRVLFGPWRDVIAMKPADLPAAMPRLVTEWTRQRDRGELNPRLAEALTRSPPSTVEGIAERYESVFSETVRRWSGMLAEHDRAAAEARKKGAAEPPRPSVFPDAADEALREMMFGTPTATTPGGVSAAELEPYFSPEAKSRLASLRGDVEALKKAEPASPEFANVMKEGSPNDVHVFIRGNPGNPGEPAPRGFPGLLAAVDRRPIPAKESGRLQLAELIASPSNPLTARVLVNRVWQHHFGHGIVRTPSDFGARGEKPTHPELLDYLAAYFVDHGWSIKQLHRAIMLSTTYQMSTRDDPHAARVDPENRLLWRMNRQRLDLEGLRDSLLAASGKLDAKLYGKSVEIAAPPFSNRRSVYGYIDRQNLPAFFRSFDFASPDATSGQRFVTTVPQQALFLMNSPFVLSCAQGLAARPDVASVSVPTEKIRRLYRAALARSPRPDELALGAAFVRTATSSPDLPVVERSPWSYGYGSLDAKTGRLEFHLAPHFTGTAWQGGEKLPDPALGWFTLTASGGHPGDSAHLAIRRFTAPHRAVVMVRGGLVHRANEGDGVEGWIVSSRTGILGHWTAHHGRAMTELDRIDLAAGDTLDFVVGPRADVGFDAFEWAPFVAELKAGTTTASAGPPTRTWSAAEGFGGPYVEPKPLDPWVQYAQILLETNEFAFVD